MRLFLPSCTFSLPRLPSPGQLTTLLTRPPALPSLPCPACPCCQAPCSFHRKSFSATGNPSLVPAASWSVQRGGPAFSRALDMLCSWRQGRLPKHGLPLPGLCLLEGRPHLCLPEIATSFKAQGRPSTPGLLLPSLTLLLPPPNTPVLVSFLFAPLKRHGPGSFVMRLFLNMAYRATVISQLPHGAPHSCSQRKENPGRQARRCALRALLTLGSLTHPGPAVPPHPLSSLLLGTPEVGGWGQLSSGGLEKTEAGALQPGGLSFLGCLSIPSLSKSG